MFKSCYMLCREERAPPQGLSCNQVMMMKLALPLLLKSCQCENEWLVQSLLLSKWFISLLLNQSKDYRRDLQRNASIMLLLLHDYWWDTIYAVQRSPCSFILSETPKWVKEHLFSCMFISEKIAFIIINRYNILYMK